MPSLTLPCLLLSLLRMIALRAGHAQHAAKMSSKAVLQRRQLPNMLIIPTRTSNCLQNTHKV